MELLLADKERIRQQFDYLCKLVIKGERCSYIKGILKRAEREIPFSDMPEFELNSLHTTDKYPIENAHYSVMGFNVEVLDDKLAEAIDELSPVKRDVILLYYFVGMNGSEIAEMMGKDRSVVNYHKRNALSILKKSMESRGR